MYIVDCAIMSCGDTRTAVSCTLARVCMCAGERESTQLLSPAASNGSDPLAICCVAQAAASEGRGGEGGGEAGGGREEGAGVADDARSRSALRKADCVSVSVDVSSTAPETNAEGLHKAERSSRSEEVAKGQAAELAAELPTLDCASVSVDVSSTVPRPAFGASLLGSVHGGGGGGVEGDVAGEDVTVEPKCTIAHQQAPGPSHAAAADEAGSLSGQDAQALAHAPEAHSHEQSTVGGDASAQSPVVQQISMIGGRWGVEEGLRARVGRLLILVPGRWGPWPFVVVSLSVVAGSDDAACCTCDSGVT